MSFEQDYSTAIAAGARDCDWLARTLPMFEGLDKPLLEALLGEFDWVAIQGGNTLFEAGDAPDALYCVISGSLGAFKQTAEGHPLSANAIARAMAEAEGAALPGGSPVLSDDVALVDRIIARAPFKTQRGIYIHYRSWTSADVKARRLARELSLPNVSRATFYVEVKASLWYVTGALQNVGLDLRAV